MINYNGISKDEEISSITDLEGPSQQYVLVTEDSEYLFNGYKVSENYIKSLWNALGTDNQPIPKITVILTIPQYLTQITDNEVTAFSTPLLPEMDSYLILVTFKDYQQFKDSLQCELVRIWGDGYVHSLSGNELLSFDKTVKDLAVTYGIPAPRLIYDNKTLGVV